MEAKNYFLKLSYEQYKRKKVEEREKWESEVLLSIIERAKKEENSESHFSDTFMEMVNEIELVHSNSFKIEKLVNDILKREENEQIVQILNNCWIASWDLPDTKNACVEIQQFFDGSHLIRINTELLINLSRVVWLYTTILLLEDITPYACFQERISLNVIKQKFAEDLKDDTDMGSFYLMDCYLTLGTKKMLNKFVSVYYESAVVFILMHEVGHILELNEDICKQLGLNSSKIHEGLPRDEKQRYAEKNADKIGYKYADDYVGVESFFNMGPVLLLLTLAVNHKNIKQETDHPSLKSRYENALSALFKEKELGEVMHTRKLLYTICEVMQDENCWSVEDRDWWKNEIGLP